MANVYTIAQSSHYNAMLLQFCDAPQLDNHNIVMLRHRAVAVLKIVMSRYCKTSTPRWWRFRAPMGQKLVFPYCQARFCAFSAPFRGGG
jgi:hypothetical protein